MAPSPPSAVGRKGRRHTLHSSGSSSSSSFSTCCCCSDFPPCSSSPSSAPCSPSSSSSSPCSSSSSSSFRPTAKVGLDDSSVDRLLIVDCHDRFQGLVEKGVLDVFLGKWSRPQVIVGVYAINSEKNPYGHYCHIRAQWLLSGRRHFHVDAGCMGFIGTRDIFLRLHEPVSNGSSITTDSGSISITSSDSISKSITTTISSSSSSSSSSSVTNSTVTSTTTDSAASITTKSSSSSSSSGNSVTTSDSHSGSSSSPAATAVRAPTWRRRTVREALMDLCRGRRAIYGHDEAVLEVMIGRLYRQTGEHIWSMGGCVRADTRHFDPEEAAAWLAAQEPAALSAAVSSSSSSSSSSASSSSPSSSVASLLKLYRSQPDGGEWTRRQLAALPSLGIEVVDMTAAGTSGTAGTTCPFSRLYMEGCYQANLPPAVEARRRKALGKENDKAAVAAAGKRARKR